MKSEFIKKILLKGKKDGFKGRMDDFSYEGLNKEGKVLAGKAFLAGLSSGMLYGGAGGAIAGGVGGAGLNALFNTNKDKKNKE